MVPGVIGVSSTGVYGNKAYYSNYASRFCHGAARLLSLVLSHVSRQERHF